MVAYNLILFGFLNMENKPATKTYCHTSVIYMINYSMSKMFFSLIDSAVKLIHRHTCYQWYRSSLWGFRNEYRQDNFIYLHSHLTETCIWTKLKNISNRILARLACHQQGKIWIDNCFRFRSHDMYSTVEQYSWIWNGLSYSFTLNGFKMDYTDNIKAFTQPLSLWQCLRSRKILGGNQHTNQAPRINNLVWLFILVLPSS